MNAEEIRDHCMAMADVEECFPFGEETLVFKTGGKIFLLVSLMSVPLQFNAKCDPEQAIELRDKYAAVTPGYHMNKRHWNTVVIDNTMSRKELKALINHSYQLVVQPKKKKLMRLLITTLILAASVAPAAAQETIPFRFTSEEENRVVKETDSVKYYVASGDTTDVVAINEETSFYRLYSKNHKVLAEGSFIQEGETYRQQGKWTERYDNGKIKKTGYYELGLQAGTWEEYYDNGKPRAIANYALLKTESGVNSCLSGTYKEYYKSGKLKAVGLYIATMTIILDKNVVQDPVTLINKIVATSHASYQPEKVGHWEYYDENGETEKKEE